MGLKGRRMLVSVGTMMVAGLAESEETVPGNDPGWWYETTDCSDTSHYLNNLADVPLSAESYKYADENDDRCYLLAVVRVTGSPVNAPSFLSLYSYIYYSAWNTGIGYRQPNSLYVVREREVALEPPSPVYRAGICPRELGTLPLRLGIVRHDDVVSHVEYSDIAPRRSGYFAANDTEAFAAAAADADYYIRHFRWPSPLTLVPGVHRHRKEKNCAVSLPVVSKTRFDKIRADSGQIQWNWYHLLLCNCQHWAELVVNGVDNRRDDCRRP